MTAESELHIRLWVWVGRSREKEKEDVLLTHTRSSQRAGEGGALTSREKGKE